MPIPIASVEESDPKIADVAGKWLEYTKCESTREDYDRTARHFLEFLGVADGCEDSDRRIRSIRAEDFHRFALFMRERRKGDGGPYSPRAVRKAVTQFYQFINFAVEMGYLERSPAPRIRRLPLPAEPVPRKVRLSAEQARRLVDSAPEKWRDLFVLALATGARRSELFNARYADIRWEDATIEIRDVQPDGSPGAVKSRAAVRSIPLPAGVLAMLRGRMAAAGAGTGDLIFPNRVGRRVSPPNFYRRIWNPTVERAGMPGLHLHDLRKAFASQLVASGHSPSFIQEVMGHASYATTMKYYAMPPEEEMEKARLEVGEWLGLERQTTSDTPARLTERELRNSILQR